MERHHSHLFLEATESIALIAMCLIKFFVTAFLGDIYRNLLFMKWGFITLFCNNFQKKSLN
jgi:hypothetical protein